MSSQAGVFYFDGRAIDRSTLDMLANSAHIEAADRTGQHVTAGVAFVHSAIHITPEDTLERQPLVSGRGNVIGWCGRLDNRDDLVYQLWPDLAGDTTDVALALAAYEKWGADSFAKLIGDWSAVIWNAEQRAIILARDYMGIRPLHYRLRLDSLWWSTSLDRLVLCHDAFEYLDERFILGYLTTSLSSDLTPYRDVHSVPAGHYLTITHREAVRCTQYWRLSNDCIRFRDHRLYEEGLRHHFVTSVKSRLRSKAPVWAQLSGGLDSSSVICAADILVKRRAVAAPDLITVSYITDGSPDSDERRFMKVIDERRGRSSRYLQLDEHNESTSPLAWLTPRQPEGVKLETHRLVQQAGSSVLLTGDGGDAVMGNYLDYSFDVAQVLTQMQPLRAVSLARRRALAARRHVLGMLSEAVVEVLPFELWITRRVRRSFYDLGGLGSLSDQTIADLFLLKPRFASYWQAEITRQLKSLYDLANVSHRRMAWSVIRLAGSGALSSPIGTLTEVTHPYLHRPLVEFMLATPIGVVAPPGQPRGLMREAFAPFVPERIIRRFSKGNASPFLIRRFRARADEWLAKPAALRILGLECVDADRLFAYLKTFRDGATPNTRTIGIIVSLERWLERRANHRENKAAAVLRERVNN